MSGTSRTRRGERPSIRRLECVSPYPGPWSLPSDVLDHDPTRGCSAGWVLTPTRSFLAIAPAIRLSVHGRIRRSRGEESAMRFKRKPGDSRSTSRHCSAWDSRARRRREVQRVVLRATRTALPTPNLRLGQDAERMTMTRPSEELLPRLGLAQHHGSADALPDFTWIARERYFAATQALQKIHLLQACGLSTQRQLQMDVEIRKESSRTGQSRPILGRASRSLTRPSIRGSGHSELSSFSEGRRDTDSGNEGPPTWQPIEYMSIPALRAKGIRRFDL